MNVNLPCGLLAGALLSLCSLAAGEQPTDIWVEAESAAEHTFNGPADFPGLVSGDKILRLWKDPDPGPEGYWAKLPFQVTAPGLFHVWLAVSGGGTSPFSWQLDGGNWTRVNEDSDIPATDPFGVSGVMRWMNLTDARLGAGEHVLTVRVTERRAILEHAYLLYLDALLVTPRDVEPSGLVRPEDLPKLKPPDRSPTPPLPRVGKPGPAMMMGSSVGSPRQNRILASLGFTLLQTDSDHLTVNEVSPGKWDWSAADEGLALARKAGVAWQYFPHFHWAPDWLAQTDRFVPSIGLSTGRKLRCMSLWSPYLPAWFDHCYAALADHYGSGSDKIAAIYLGVFGDFGEALYPLGFHPGERERFGEQGTGCADFWCGDPHARAAFREAMRARYGDLARLNAAWGTDFRSWDDLAYPAMPQNGPERRSARDRRWWLDFSDWYHDSVTQFTATVARIARRRLPHARIVLPVGNGDEGVYGGCDLTALVKVCRDCGVEMRSTHGGFQPVPWNLSSMLRRLASASHFYGVPFWSEPPGGISPEGEVGRFFESLSCRASGFWDWGSNPVGAQKAFHRYRSLLTREETVCDVALLFPMTDHRLRPAVGYPPGLHALGATLRTVTDFDLLDERMVCDGALARCRVLVLAEGSFFDEGALARLEAWLWEGGVMVRGDLPMRTVDGRRNAWGRLSGIMNSRLGEPGPVEVADKEVLGYTAALGDAGPVRGVTRLGSRARVLATAAGKPAIWAHPVGRGWVIVCTPGAENLPLFRSVVRDVVYRLPALDPSKPAGRELAPGAPWGNLLTTLLASGEVVAYNDGDAPIRTAVAGQEVTVPPHSIVTVEGRGRFPGGS